MAISSEARAATRTRPLAIPARAVVGGYTVATGAALVLQGLIAPLAGTICCALLVAALLAHHALAGDERLDVLVALALVPLAAVLAVAMPIEEVPRALWPVLVGVPVLFGIALAARRLGLGRAQLGLTRASARANVRAAAAGVPLGLLAYAVLRPDRLEAGMGVLAVAGAAVVVAVFAGAAEELLLRGLVQPLAVRAAGSRGVAWTAGLSAALYAGTRSVATVALAGALALWAGGVARRRGTIASVGLAHGVLVAGALVVWPAVLGAPEPVRPARAAARPAPVPLLVAAGVSPEVVRARHTAGALPLPPAGLSPEALRARLFVPAVPAHRAHRVHHRVHHRRVHRRARPAPRRVSVVPRRAAVVPRRAAVVPRRRVAPPPRPVARPAPPVARPAPAPRPAPRPAPAPAPRPARPPQKPASSPSQSFDDSG